MGGKKGKNEIIFEICSRINTDNKHFHYAVHFPVYIRLLSLVSIGSNPQTTNVCTLNEGLFVSGHFLT